MPEDWRFGGFGLYVHWPFCAAKCPYCDFNSHVVQNIDQDAWKNAYLTSLESYASDTEGRVLNSVYFGGGTPSLMQPGTVAAILEKVAKTWTLANDLEITLEANPSSVESGRFEGYRTAGVNRVSLGIQALDDTDLRRLGRLHDVATALEALDIARSTFDRVSFDLIYARQDQSEADWDRELARALAFDPDHLSLYQLTIEPGTAFGDRFRAGRLPGLPDEDRAANMFDRTQELTKTAGLPAYEVSNHAKPGQESRHNMVYWRGGDYIGVGPGAHGRITLAGNRYATETALSPAEWLESVLAGRSGESRRAALSAKDHATEYLMMSLRMREGVDLSRLAKIQGRPLESHKINDLAELGLVEEADGSVATTPRGALVLNAVIAALLPD